ncbi:hypothetical protein [Yinghuangia sp. YIM S09857]|uniref:hypothetical protein n=1 Tax=Yinghuangia sp. YIM S09857 TaxID=3436929 RepID=UPI003F535C5F
MTTHVRAAPNAQARPQRRSRTVYLVSARRTLLVAPGLLLAAVAVAAEQNPWNFRVFETAAGSPIVIAPLAVTVLGAELALSFRSFLVWTLAGGLACCAFVMLCLALLLSMFQTAPHKVGRTVAASPDGHVHVVVTEGGPLDLAVVHRIYLRTTRGLDREVLVATGCLGNVSADVRFTGNRTLELRDRHGEYRRVQFDKNLNVDARAVLPCERHERS